MSQPSVYVHKSHNVSILLYHLVCPAKYRRIVFDTQVDATLTQICLEIAERYEIVFLEIGTDRDHVHFLIQIGALLKPHADRAYDQKSDGQRSISSHSFGQASAVEWCILVEWLLYQHGGSA